LGSNSEDLAQGPLHGAEGYNFEQARAKARNNRAAIS
jgi:hypothetical protein